MRDYRLVAGCLSLRSATKRNSPQSQSGGSNRGAPNPTLLVIALVADALGRGLSDPIAPDSGSPYVALRREDMKRAPDGLATLRQSCGRTAVSFVSLRSGQMHESSRMAVTGATGRLQAPGHVASHIPEASKGGLPKTYLNAR